MRRSLLLVPAVSLFLVVACVDPMGMMSRRGRASGREMMAMMREPGMMDEWMDEMVQDPELMSRMMQQMHEDFRRHDDGTMPLYCPMMGFTPENPPSPEPFYEPGSLSAEELYERKCSRCHALPAPSLHNPDEWAETMVRMADYIDSTGFVSADPAELDAILEHLQEAAAATNR